MTPPISPRCRAWLSVSLVFLSIVTRSIAKEQLQNITITAPLGTTNHGDPRLLCTPTKWTDTAIFFLGNYVAHSTTLKSTPGERLLSVVLAMLMALFFPTSGVQRGIHFIRQQAVATKTPLESASRAGALCTVVRGSTWRPRAGDVVRGVSLNRTVSVEPVDSAAETGNRLESDREANKQPRERHVDLEAGRGQGRDPLLSPSYEMTPLHSGSPRLVLKVQEFCGQGLFTCFQFRPPERNWWGSHGRAVHGTCQLPPGYELHLLSSKTKVTSSSRPEIHGHRETSDQENSPAASSATADRWHELASSYSFMKGFVAVLQTIFAAATIYRTKGDQLQRYGYAAFGLTVAPYLVMSVVNLLGALLTPDYPTVYLVESEIMTEAARRERDGGKFRGAVGSVQDIDAVDDDSVDVRFEIRDGRTFIRAAGPEFMETFGRIFTDFDNAGEVEVSFSGDELSSSSTLLVPPSPEYRLENRMSKKDQSALQVGWVLGCLPIIMIGALTHFKAGSNSTSAQRGWAMAWLALGIFLGPTAQGFHSGVTRKNVGETAVIWITHFISLSLILIFGIPAIGGLVVVAQMLQSYGSCIRIY